MWIVVGALAVGALWDGVTTFYGIAQAFAVFPADADVAVNGIQVTFAVVVSMVIMGFMLATHVIWTNTSEELLSYILKGAWGLSTTLDLVTSYLGNKYFVFQDKISSGTEMFGLFLITILITVSTMLLSQILLKKDVRGKGFLY